MHLFRIHPFFTFWLFVVFELLLLNILVADMVRHGAWRKNLLPVLLTGVLLLFNAIWGRGLDLFWLIFINVVALLLVVLILLIPLLGEGNHLPAVQVPLPVAEERDSDELFVLSCQKFGLSIREIQVADLIRKGMTYKQIADTLFISDKTVDAHMQNIFTKVGERNRISLLNKLENWIT